MEEREKKKALKPKKEKPLTTINVSYCYVEGGDINFAAPLTLTKFAVITCYVCMM